jgi:hypothetical protein
MERSDKAVLVQRDAGRLRKGPGEDGGLVEPAFQHAFCGKRNRDDQIRFRELIKFESVYQKLSSRFCYDGHVFQIDYGSGEGVIIGAGRPG